MQKIKMYFNKVQIIGEILSTAMVILIPIISDNKFVSLGWFFIGLTCFGDGMFTKKWSIIGRTWNKKQDSNTLPSWTSQLGIVCKGRTLLKPHKQHNAN